MDDTIPMCRRWWLFGLTALILAFLVLPVVIVIPMSFSGTRFLNFPPEIWSLRWYVRFVSDPTWYASMLLSLRLAVCTAVLATPIGLAAAYAIHNGETMLFRRLQTVLLLPLLVPHIIIAVGLFYVYARMGLLGSFPGLLGANLMLALPFVVVTALSGLRSLDRNQELAARSLGCTRFYAFTRVVLPQIRGSVLSGVIFAFVTSLDEVVVALFVSSGSNTTVTKIMFTSLRDEIDPTIAAVSSLLIVGSLLVAGLVGLAKRLERRSRGQIKEAAAA